MTASADLTIPAHLDEIPGVSFELEQCDLQLGVEEAITNIIVHGYAGSPGSIVIRCQAGPDEVSIEISDDAPAFNLLQAPEPDISAALEDRKVGGLGIFLIRKVTDSATYRYEKAKNILILTKKKRPVS